VHNNSLQASLQSCLLKGKVDTAVCRCLYSAYKPVDDINKKENKKMMGRGEGGEIVVRR
jgi:hypothetical protein